MSLKRLAAPGFWPVEKKTKKYVIKPMPGPHSKRKCMPLGLIIRDILKYARSGKEVDSILNNGYVRVDGKIRKKKNFSVGLMDVVTIGDECYRMIPTAKGLNIVKIDKTESRIKLLKILNKTCVRRGRMQLNLHDGKNIMIENGNYNTNDVIVFDFESRKINDVVKLEKGCRSIITGGRNMGSVVSVDDIIVTRSAMPNQVVVDMNGKKFVLPQHYVFPVGKDKPLINIGEAA